MLAPTTASATAAKATAIAMTATRLAATWEHPAVVDCNGSQWQGFTHMYP